MGLLKGIELSTNGTAIGVMRRYAPARIITLFGGVKAQRRRSVYILNALAKKQGRGPGCNGYYTQEGGVESEAR